MRWRLRFLWVWERVCSSEPFLDMLQLLVSFSQEPFLLETKGKSSVFDPYIKRGFQGTKPTCLHYRWESSVRAVESSPLPAGSARWLHSPVEHTLKKNWISMPSDFKDPISIRRMWGISLDQGYVIFSQSSQFWNTSSVGLLFAYLRFGWIGWGEWQRFDIAKCVSQVLEIKSQKLLFNTKQLGLVTDRFPANGN